MIFLQSLFGLATASIIIALLIPQINRIKCLWENLHYRHEKSIESKIQFYQSPIKPISKECNLIINKSGFTTPFYIFFTMVFIYIFFETSYHILKYRQRILHREEVISCMAYFEKKAQNFYQQMEKLNSLIPPIYASELAAKNAGLAPLAVSLMSSRLLLEQGQNILLSKFLLFKKKPFPCIELPWNFSLGYEMTFTILKRNPLTHALVKKLTIPKQFFFLKKHSAYLSLRWLKNTMTYSRQYRELQ